MQVPGSSALLRLNESDCRGWVVLFIFLKSSLSQVWWFMPVISAPRRQKQKDLEFEASQGYIADPVSKKKKLPE
jgi:hypothetical protein